MTPIELKPGERFGKLSVIKRSDESKRGEIRWLCRCDCGAVRSYPGSELRTGRTVSCGCKKKIEPPSKTHGESKTKLYNVWKTMRRRCYAKTSNRYSYYGGRGISVCDDWAKYENFRDWSYSHGYVEGLSLDRIDNDGDYCPENCRWVDMKTQSNNRRNSLYVEINGVTRPVREWGEIYGISPYTLYSRLRKGVTGNNLLRGAINDTN